MLTRLATLSRYWGFRLVAVTGIVMVSLLSLVLYKNATLFERAAIDRENRHLQEIAVLVDAALAPELEQGSLGEAVGTLDRLRGQQGIEYLVLVDAFGRTLYAQGWPADRPLPEAHAALSRLNGNGVRFDGQMGIQRDGRSLGVLHYGLSLAWLADTYNGMILKGMLIGGAVAFACLLFLAFISEWLTRDLHRLQEGVTAFQNGKLPARLPVTGPEEVAQLTRAFNEMVLVLYKRLDALKRSKRRFHAIADYTYGAEAWISPQGRMVWCNRSIERVTGYTPEECLMARDLVEMLVYEKDRAFVMEKVRSELREARDANLEVRLRRKDGSMIWAAVNWQTIFAKNGNSLGLRISFIEIQQRKEAETKLLDTVAELRRTQGLKEFYLTRSEEEKARLKALLDVMQIGVVFVGRDQRVVYCNLAFRRIWGLPEDDDLHGVRADTLLQRTAALRQDDNAYRVYVQRLAAEHGRDTDHQIELADGRIVALSTDLIPGPDEGQFSGRIWTIEDITERKRQAEQLMHLATRDPLTNLYNRRRFYEEMGRALADATRRKLQAGLVVIDLDGFKPINDEFGHQAGDSVLIKLAETIGSTIRRNEMFFRLGGDEFAILASDANELEMVQLARRVSTQIETMEFVFEERTVKLTASLGIAIYPLHGETAEEIVAHADHAMYRAKMAGKNRWQIYANPRQH